MKDFEITVKVPVKTVRNFAKYHMCELEDFSSFKSLGLTIDEITDYFMANHMDEIQKLVVKYMNEVVSDLEEGDCGLEWRIQDMVDESPKLKEIFDLLDVMDQAARQPKPEDPAMANLAMVLRANGYSVQRN